MLERLGPQPLDLSLRFASHDTFRHCFGPTAIRALDGYVEAERRLQDRAATVAALLRALVQLLVEGGSRSASQNTEATGSLENGLAGMGGRMTHGGFR